MSISLFALAGEYREQFDRLEQMELDEKTLADTLESISGDIEEKAINVAKFIKNLEAGARAIEDQAEIMKSRSDAIKKKAEHMKDYLLANLQHAKVAKIESPFFVIAIRKNPQSLKIDDEKKIPPRFLAVPKPPEPYIDKDAVKKALKAGHEVPGARLEQKNRLEIR